MGRVIRSFGCVWAILALGGAGGVCAGSEAAADSSQHIAGRIVESSVPVLIDFWAPWCAPCRIVSPIVEQLGREYRGRISVEKINIDRHQQITRYFGVASIPAVFIVKDKVVRKTIAGARSQEDYRAAIEEVLAMADADSTVSGGTATAPAPAVADSSHGGL